MNLKEKRALYVRSVYDQHNNKEAALKKLKEELFVCRATIYNDLRKSLTIRQNNRL